MNISESESESELYQPKIMIYTCICDLVVMCKIKNNIGKVVGKNPQSLLIGLQLSVVGCRQCNSLYTLTSFCSTQLHKTLG